MSDVILPIVSKLTHLYWHFSDSSMSDIPMLAKKMTETNAKIKLQNLTGEVAKIKD